MAANTTRVLIETIVRRTLREIQSAPERNIRNLVDMALNFSKGRFQKQFFESTQRMLANEHNMLYDMQSMNAPITALIPDEGCSVSEREIVYDYVLRKREGQKFPTILWDMIQDVLGIDTIISDDCCSAGFRADGSFFALSSGQVIGNWNLFEHDLRSILSGCLKK